MNARIIVTLPVENTEDANLWFSKVKDTFKENEIPGNIYTETYLDMDF